MAFTLFFQATTWNALKTSILVKKKKTTATTRKPANSFPWHFQFQSSVNEADDRALTEYMPLGLFHTYFKWSSIYY